MKHNEAYQNCMLCPRRCGVDRMHGDRGVCGETATLRISHNGAHFGEEPSFSGMRGSGTIFFSGCSSQCFFCQNYQISIQHEGREYTEEEFFLAVKELIAKKVHNLNFVTPDHFWPHIKTLCLKLQKEDVSIPTVFNSSGYQEPGMIEEYAEYMDMFMPDFKFAQGPLAKICMKDENYPQIALEAIRRMVKAKGFLEPWDPAGKKTAEKGVLIRHLVLPGHADNSIDVLKIIHKEFGSGIPLSVMSQYQPMPGCRDKKDFSRTLHTDEYQQILECVEKLGFEHVYIQELMEKTDYLPDFHDPEDPFPGHRKKAQAEN